MIEILKKNNPARMNHGLIGNVLAAGCGKYEASAHDSLGETAMMTIEKYVNENGEFNFKEIWDQVKLESK